MESFHKRTGKPISFIGKYCSLPMFIANPTIYADHLEDRAHGKQAEAYRSFAKLLQGKEE
jgi:hypothetical protein